MKKYCFYFSLVMGILYFLICTLFDSENHILGHMIGALVTFVISLFLSVYLINKNQPQLLGEKQYMEEAIKERAFVNHLKRGIAVGGVGYLLKDKFVFISHKHNLQVNDFTILLSDIDVIVEYRILIFFNVGLKFILKSGEKEKFIIDKSSHLYSALISY